MGRRLAHAHRGRVYAAASAALDHESRGSSARTLDHREHHRVICESRSNGAAVRIFEPSHPPPPPQSQPATSFFSSPSAGPPPVRAPRPPLVRRPPPQHRAARTKEHRLFYKKTNP